MRDDSWRRAARGALDRARSRRAPRGGWTRRLAPGGVVLVAALAAGPAAAENLVPNGDLERGGPAGPDGWQRPDGLTSFWVKDPLRKGKCLRFDTDVYKEEARARWAEMERADPPPPRPKTPTRGAKYNTVGGVNGVPFYGGFIPVKPGQAYRLQVDVLAGRCGLPGKRKMAPKVFIKGYVMHRGRRRVLFKIYKNCQAKPGRWTTSTLYFHPTDRTPRVKTLRVMLFPYWPPGEYFFDNVRVTPVPTAVWKKERAKVKALEKARREAFGGKTRNPHE